MNKIYILYLEDVSVCSGLTYPSLNSGLEKSYPLLWIGNTKSDNVYNIIYDKRSNYNKFKKNERYYIDYMEIFKYLEENPELSLKIHVLENDVDDKYLESRMIHYIGVYRLFYGSSLFVKSVYVKRCLGDFLTRFVVEEPVKIKKTQEQIRQALNAKSARYYQRNKDRLKEKRENAKKKILEEKVFMDSSEKNSNP